MSGPDWPRLLRGATDDFADILATSDLAATVPTCPGWTLADLGNHLRGVHLWAAHAVTEGDPKGSDDAADARAFTLDTLPVSELVFDHSTIVSDYVTYKRTGKRRKI